MTAGEPQLTKIVIDSVDVSAYRQTWEERTTRSNVMIRVVNVSFVKAVEDAITVDASLMGKSATIQRGILTATEEYVIRGVVVDVQLSGGTIKISIADKLYLTGKRTITKSFDKNIDSEAGKYSEIFKTLINDYTELTANSTSVQDSGTVNTLTKFVCKSVTVLDRIKVLCDTLGWQAYYNSNTDLVYFEPVGFTNQSSVLSTAVNIRKTPKWTINSESLYNYVEVRGSRQLVETTETGTIGTTDGYTTTSVTLTQTPFSVKVFCDAGPTPTTLRTGGKQGSSTDYDYYVDAENKKIMWSDTYAPIANDDAEIRYSYPLPTPVVVYDQYSIDTYSQGEASKKIMHRLDILEQSDAETFANEFLTKHKYPLLKTTLQVVDVSDLNVGQKVQVVDEFNGVDNDFYIIGISRKYPYRFDEIEIVSEIFDDNMFTWEVQQRIKRLEEEMSGNTDILLHAIASDREVIYEPRYMILEKTDCSAFDGIILDHYAMGLDDASYGVDGTGDVVTNSKIVQGNNTYKEFIYDDDFEDTGVSTADWNTTTKQIEIVAGGSGTLTTNLTRYWSMDDNAANTTVTDATGTENAVLARNTNSATTAGVVSSAIACDGSASQYCYINSTTLGIANAWTVNFWWKTTAIATADYVWRFRPSSGDANEIRFITNSSKMNCLIMHSSGSGTGYKSYAGNSTLLNNTWYMLTLTWDGTDLKLYLNGSEDTPYTKAKDDAVTMTSTDRILGMAGWNGGAAHQGTFDEVGVWSRALSGAEVVSLYNGGSGFAYPFLSSDEVLQTSSIAKGTTYTYFTVSLASYTGTGTVYITQDGGSTWQAVTLNTRTLFNHSGTDVRLKIIPTTTMTLINTYYADGSYNEPAIYCKLEE